MLAFYRSCTNEPMVALRMAMAIRNHSFGIHGFGDYWIFVDMGNKQTNWGISPGYDAFGRIQIWLLVTGTMEYI